MRSWWRFTLVGLLGAALQLALFALFMKISRLAAWIVTPLTVELAILHNFMWHERFTWRDRYITTTMPRRLARFQAGNGLISLFGNTILTYLLVEHFSIPPIPSAISSIALCSLVNFLIADRWVYAGLY